MPAPQFVRVICGKPQGLDGRSVGSVSIILRNPRCRATAVAHQHDASTSSLQQGIDATEEFLLAVFLRRYVTYCARRGRFAAMTGAARLHAEIGAAAK
jgi:hypothetical protein